MVIGPALNMPNGQVRPSVLNFHPPCPSGLVGVGFRPWRHRTLVAGRRDGDGYLSEMGAPFQESEGFGPILQGKTLSMTGLTRCCAMASAIDSKLVREPVVMP